MTHAKAAPYGSSFGGNFSCQVPLEGTPVHPLPMVGTLLYGCRGTAARVQPSRWLVRTLPLTRVHCHDSTRRALSVLAFGIPFSEDRITANHGTEVVRLFSPGALFCIVWRRLSLKRQHRTLTILEAPRARGEGDPVLDVHPAAIVHVFMDQYGPAGQERSIDEMLDLIQSIRKRGIEPARVTARYWRRASRRILLGQRPPEFAAGDFPDQEQSA